MKPQHPYDQTSQTLVSLKFYADTSAYGLSNLQPVQVYYASMSYDFFFQERGKRHYELTNHLGNVLTVISDKRMLVCNADTVTYSYASIISATDYSPFGAPLAGRTFSSESYRFRFNGKENDKEIYGDGNALDFGARVYDSRLGRFLSLDRYKGLFPNSSPFSFAGNNPMFFIDFNGDYKIKPSDVELYKRSSAYLQNGIKHVLASPELKNLLLELGEVNETQLNEIFNKNGGPEVWFIEPQFGLCLFECKVPDVISISPRIANLLENAKTIEEQQVAALILMVEVLHETIHYSRFMYENKAKGIEKGNCGFSGHYQETKYWKRGIKELEVGNLFEILAFKRPFGGDNDISIESRIIAAKEVIKEFGSKDIRIPQSKDLYNILDKPAEKQNSDTTLKR